VCEQFVRPRKGSPHAGHEQARLERHFDTIEGTGRNCSHRGSHITVRDDRDDWGSVISCGGYSPKQPEAEAGVDD
jgi:hypothetical protein